MDTALRVFAKTWVVLVILLNVIAIAGFLIGAPSLWSGWTKVTEVYSPFNVSNWLVELVILSPALGSLHWLRRREDRRGV